VAEEGPNWPAATSSTEGGSQGRDRSSVVTLAAAVVTGLGTLGWVTFIGGAILWISFQQAHLPSGEAVAKVPTSVLIATGAEFVVAAVGAALVTNVVLYFFDNRRRRAETHRRIKETERLTMQLAAKRQRETEAAQSVERNEAQLKAVEREPAPSQDAVAQKHDHAQAQLRQAREEVKETNDALTAASSSTWREVALAGAMPTAMLAITAIGAAWWVDLGYGSLPIHGFLAVCLVAVAAGVIGAILYSHTLSFPIMGLVALIAVPVVMGVAIYFRVQNAPRVEPVALLRSDGTPFVGFFLAETSDRVYVGTFEELAPDPCDLVRRRRCESEVEQIKVPARLLSLPATDVQNLTVGPRIPLNANDALDDPSRPRTAREWAAGAALRLCEAASAAKREAEAIAVSGAAAGGTPAALPKTCSDEAVDDLRQFDEEERRVIAAVNGGTP
jgi:uncharacterized membrane protein YhiD involved in acid resistance